MKCQGERNFKTKSAQLYQSKSPFWHPSKISPSITTTLKILKLVLDKTKCKIHDRYIQ